MPNLYEVVVVVVGGSGLFIIFVLQYWKWKPGPCSCSPSVFPGTAFPFPSCLASPLGREKGKNRFTKCTQAQEGNAAWASRRLRDAEYEEASGLEENHEIPE